MDKERTEKDTTQGDQAKRMVLVTFQAGCLTFIIAGLALIAGLWVDSRLGTPPRWTLIALIASAPLAFGGVFLLVRRALRRSRQESEFSAAVNQNTGD